MFNFRDFCYNNERDTVLRKLTEMKSLFSKTDKTRNKVIRPGKSKGMDIKTQLNTRVSSFKIDEKEHNDQS